MTVVREGAARLGVMLMRESSHPTGVAIKAIYVLMQCLDLALTLLGTYLGYAEVNPVMRSLLASPSQLIAVKILIPLLVAWLIPGRLLIPAIVFLGLVIGWNVRELVGAA